MSSKCTALLTDPNSSLWKQVLKMNKFKKSVWKRSKIYVCIAKKKAHVARTDSRDFSLLGIWFDTSHCCFTHLDTWLHPTILSPTVLEVMLWINEQGFGQTTEFISRFGMRKLFDKCTSDTENILNIRSTFQFWYFQHSEIQPADEVVLNVGKKQDVVLPILLLLLALVLFNMIDC